MVVTCPNCRSRYAVDPLKIGPAGRTVECARCHHQWHQKVDGAPAIPELVIRPTTTAPPCPPSSRPSPPSRGAARSRWASSWCVLIAAVLFVFRAKIATMISYEARASAPVQVATTRRRLRRQRRRGPLPPRPRRARRQRPSRGRRSRSTSPTSSIDAVDGHFVVRGQLVNNGRAPGSTTLLRLTFKRNEDVLGERSFPMVEGPLPPGGRTAFSQVIDNPPAGTTDIVPSVE